MVTVVICSLFLFFFLLFCCLSIAIMLNPGCRYLEILDGHYAHANTSHNALDVYYNHLKIYKKFHCAKRFFNER